jgi:hypothetical protein
MPAGMHYSTDGGSTWELSAADGLPRSIIQVAVHPDEAGAVAVASQDGLYLSTDYGDTFSPISSGLVTSVAFDLVNPDRVLYGYDQLQRVDTQTGETTTLFTPKLGGDNDGLMYIAVNPVSGVVAASTFSRRIYLSDDARGDWELIVEDGISVN